MEYKLSNYQQETVEHLDNVYKRQRAYIVADEVGLGKTFVALGLIDKLESKRIIYIASNAQIAKQNVDKLEKYGLIPYGGTSDRLSLYDFSEANKSENKDEKYVIRLSPATTFTGKGSEKGNAAERKKYVCSIRKMPPAEKTELAKYLTAIPEEYKEKYEKMLSWYGIGQVEFKDYITLLNQTDESLQNDEIKESLKRLKAFFAVKYNERVTPGLAKELLAKKDILKHYSFNCLSKIVGEMRGYFNDKAMKAYKPDLIIMDEFHRFHSLLDVSGESMEYNMWKYLSEDEEGKKCKILLLSATPYLYNKESQTNINNRNDELKNTRDSDTPFENLDQLIDYINTINNKEPKVETYDVEWLYNNILCRTQRDWLIAESRKEFVSEESKSAWKDHFAWIAEWKKRTVLPHKNLLKYIDEAPECECFSSGYKYIKEGENSKVDKARETFSEKLREKLKEYDEATPEQSLLKRAAGHYKWEMLKKHAIPQGAELLLWVPPTINRRKSAGYFLGAGFKEYEPSLRNFGKTLVFGHFRLSTRAIAALSSMEAQSRLNAIIGTNTVTDEIIFENHHMEKLTSAFKRNSGNLSTIKDAIKSFFNTEYSRRVITAWAIKTNRCVPINRDTVRDYCLAAGWEEMIKEYLYILEYDADKFCNNIDWTENDMTRVIIMPDWIDTGYRCSFGERYTADYSDKGAHDYSTQNSKSTTAKPKKLSTANREGYIKDRFLSPFYPFVLAASETAQEGVDLHNYCAKIVHWSVPSRVQIMVQEEGRIDRRSGLAIRRQMVDLYSAWKEKCQNSPELTVENMFKIAHKICLSLGLPPEKIDEYHNTGLFPQWFLPVNPSASNRQYIESHLYCLDFSTEKREYNLLKQIMERYVTFGVKDSNESAVDLKMLCPYVRKRQK